MVGNATNIWKILHLHVCDNHKIHTSIMVDSPNQNIDNKKGRN